MERWNSVSSVLVETYGLKLFPCALTEGRSKW